MSKDKDPLNLAARSDRGPFASHLLYQLDAHALAVERERQRKADSTADRAFYEAKLQATLTLEQLAARQEAEVAAKKRQYDKQRNASAIAAPVLLFTKPTKATVTRQNNRQARQLTEAIDAIGKELGPKIIAEITNYSLAKVKKGSK